MKENITLTLKTDAVSKDSKKDGTKLVGKFGPYWLIKAETVEEGWVSWFGKTASDLKAGATITGNLETKTENGFTNKNFTFPKKTDGVNPEEFRRLTNRVTTLELAQDRIKAEIKSDLMLEFKGKVQTTADFENYSKPHPMAQVDEIPLDVYEGDF